MGKEARKRRASAQSQFKRWLMVSEGGISFLSEGALRLACEKILCCGRLCGEKASAEGGGAFWECCYEPGILCPQWWQNNHSARNL